MKRRALECVLVLAIVFVFARVFSSSTGSIHYFSPDTLESKYRAVQRLLGLVPTYISWLRDNPSPLAEYLVANGYWAPRNASRPRWIVTGHSSPDRIGGLSWLHRILHRKDEKWIAWTEANPELARFVWPRFLESMRKQRTQNEAIALLLLAERAESVEELQQLVKKSERLSDDFKKSIANAAK
jgi:hypothetical protein